MQQNCVICGQFVEHPCQRTTSELPSRDPVLCFELESQPVAPDGNGHIVPSLECSAAMDMSAVVVMRQLTRSDIHLLSTLRPARRGQNDRVSA